jgi:FkbM family methyltransferase
MLLRNFKEEIKFLYKNRIKQTYVNLTKDDIIRDGIIIFGAGMHGKLLLDELLAHNIVPNWIIDKNKDLINQKINEIYVRSLNSLAEIDNQFVLLASSYINSMIDDCINNNIKKWILPAALKKIFSVNGQFGDYKKIKKNFNDLIFVHSILEDQLSKEIFKNFIKFHLTFQLNLIDYYDPNIYFPNNLVEQINYSHFVDAGAYIGDTLESWVHRYKPQDKKNPYSYFAIEPCTEQYNKLLIFVKSLPSTIQKHIFTEKCALGSKPESLSLAGIGAASTLKPSQCSYDSNETVLVKRLDELLADQTPTIIKADVEGFENHLLEGARSIIKRARPTLAISVYHNYSDIWEIPIWINNLDCNYKLFLRHHMPAYGDTVCYAIAR